MRTVQATRAQPDAGLRAAAAIIEVARDLAGAIPPPREAPYFCLDSDASYDLAVLDTLCARGIFRKYEFALDANSGLGGRARWLAARLGCRVLGVDSRVPVVQAAALLNRRAHRDEQVAFQAGRLTALPLRERVFTHVWMIDSAYDDHAPAALAEAFRVLRRGGYFALQCVGAADAERLLEVLRAVGFIELEAQEVRFRDVPHASRLAADRLQRRLGGELAPVDRHDGEIPSPHPDTGVQVFARRPA